MANLRTATHRPHLGASTRRLVAVVATAMVLVVAGCTEEGGADFGSVLVDDTLVDSPPATGPLKMSLSRGFDEEIADAPVGEIYALRFTLRNGTEGPASMGGIQLDQVQGDLRFVDALAEVRANGLDREARVFKGWPPSKKRVGMEEFDQFSTAIVPAGGAIDVLVAFQLGSGLIGRFSGVTIVYSAGGVSFRPVFDLAVALCSGAYVDGEDCAGESQLDKLIDLNDLGREADPSADVDSAN